MARAGVELRLLGVRPTSSEGAEADDRTSPNFRGVFRGVAYKPREGVRSASLWALNFASYEPADETILSFAGVLSMFPLGGRIGSLLGDKWREAVRLAFEGESDMEALGMRED